MKRLSYILFACVIPFFMSCEEKGSVVNIGSSNITVTATDSTSSSVSITFSASLIKGLGLSSVGVCYTTSNEPTYLDSKVEQTVNLDTLKEDKLTIKFVVTNLTKSTSYYIKGFIKSANNTLYSIKINFRTKSKPFTINVSSDFIPSGQEYWIVISNQSTTLLTQKIENGQSYTFDQAVPSKVDYHLFKWNSSLSDLYVVSYRNVTPDEFNLDNPFTTYPNVGQVNVTISDVSNFLRWGIATSWWWYSTTSSTTYQMYTSLSKNPDDLFIFYIPTSLSDAPKYKHVTNVTPDATYTYTMSNLTSFTNFSNITLPTNSYFNYNVGGYNTDYYADYKRYHGHSYSSGYSGAFKLYYPIGINTNFYFYAYYNTSNQQCLYNKLGSLPTSYFSTFPSITIDNSSSFSTAMSHIANYSNYDVQSFTGYYSSSPLYVQWDYYQKTQGMDTVIIPDFPDEVKAKINYLTVSDLYFDAVGYIDIINGQVNSYSSYFDLLVRKSSRYYDVIKERRNYYQWFGSKSKGKSFDRNSYLEE